MSTSLTRYVLAMLRTPKAHSSLRGTPAAANPQSSFFASGNPSRSNSIYCRFAPIRYEINPSFAKQTYRVRQHISSLYISPSARYANHIENPVRDLSRCVFSVKDNTLNVLSFNLKFDFEPIVRNAIADLCRRFHKFRVCCKTVVTEMIDIDHRFFVANTKVNQSLVQFLIGVKPHMSVPRARL